MAYSHFIPVQRSVTRALLILALVCALLQWSAFPAAASYHFDLHGPTGSGQFGYSVTALPNGNLVVTDPYYDKGAIADVGAVYLYHGVTGALISTLTGSTTNDNVGSGGVKVLANGNYLVLSPLWNFGAATNAGAVTWGSKTNGVSGEISDADSLIGNHINDKVGQFVTILSNGNYVVNTPSWDAPGPVVNVGAVTWGNGATGTKGSIAAGNSLVGSSPDDRIGYAGITELSTNGNYVVKSIWWDGVAVDTGAATLVNGATGMPVGAVHSSNSLVGSTADDNVGIAVTPLTNGNYVVLSPNWDGTAINTGAATLVDGATGLPKGAVSSSNSLVGSTANDYIGAGNAYALTNGNYVVCSPLWDNSAGNVGAATWGDGVSGITGPVLVTNSLHGSTVDDAVCFSVAALSNGNYVVQSPGWDGIADDVGAATWVNGATGLPKGDVSSSNSLVGSTADDLVGSAVTALINNGNFVVQSPAWNNVGAATWVNGASGLPNGEVSSSNSLAGSTADDLVGGLVTPLTNGNYVVCSPLWDGAAADTGAATWGDGDSGITGPVSSSNSLVGRNTDDMVSSGTVIALQTGNYVVSSPLWDNSAANVGAVTWRKGSTGTAGPVSSSNSLVGSTADDLVGMTLTGVSIMPLTTGDYVVFSPAYDNGGITNSGAVTWGTTGSFGSITADNSVLGMIAGGGLSMNFSFNRRYVYLAVGRPAENLVTLFWLSRNFLPVIKK